MTADSIIKWLVHNPAMQRDKLTTLREHYVAAIREMYDDDLQRVVREIKKRINSKKLAAELAAFFADVTRDRVAKPRGESATREATAAPASAGDGNRRAELEAAIAADPDAQAPYLPYGDWLESIGDPFGPLVAIDRELAKNPGHKAMKIARRDYFARHERELMGPLADAAGMLHDVAWHMGFIRKCRLVRNWSRNASVPHVPFVDVLRWLLDEPGPGRFVRDLEISGEPRSTVPASVAIAAKPRPAMQSLYLDWDTSDGLLQLWAALPNLRKLVLRAGCAQGHELVAAASAMPALASLRIGFGDITQGVVRGIADAAWPSLVELELQNSVEDGGAIAEPADLIRLFDERCAPKLRRLVLQGFYGGDELCEALAKSALLDRLDRLDLARSTIGERGAIALLSRSAALAKLEVNLDENFIPEPQRIKLVTTAKLATLGHQRDDGGDPARRFVAVYE